MEKNENKNPKLSILIPVRNEGINLKTMLKMLNAVIEAPNEMLVVYDTLDDNSIPVVKEAQKTIPNIRGVHNKLGKGVINAIKSGVEAARAEYIFIIAADDIGPVISVEKMLKLMDQGCDLVSATRYAYGGRIMGGFFISRLASRIVNKLFYHLSGSAFTDSTIGIKMFRKSAFNKIKLEARPVGWAVTFELAIKAQAEGLRLGEVPIISINRFYGGKSSFKLGSWSNEYFKWFWWGFKKLRSSGKRRKNIKISVISDKTGGR